MTTPSNSIANAIASADFPLAVGPATTTTGASFVMATGRRVFSLQFPEISLFSYFPAMAFKTRTRISIHCRGGNVHK
jgi:hypothetical protein